MPARKPYTVIREIGLDRFENAVIAHIEAGYLPIGGVSVFVAPAAVLGGQPAIAYVQAMIVFEAPRGPGS
ncbi:MAG: hypothetical protein A2Z40_04230 [Deltaproteobacteria bacterium RBG_19FT_COMBO_60_16]|nr:MAG: hypothetical protein A2Z40_04230 [Deltaproteobacteria bacterium RBG_19FT_COMBO_60_16]